MLSGLGWWGCWVPGTCGQKPGQARAAGDIWTMPVLVEGGGQRGGWAGLGSGVCETPNMFSFFSPNSVLQGTDL